MAKNKVRTVKEPTYTVDSEELRRFDQRNTVFNRERPDHDEKTLPPRRKGREEEIDTLEELRQNRIEKALSRGAWEVDRVLHEELLGPQKYEDSEEKADLPDPEENSRLVKAAALKLGVSRTGICKVSPLWIYSNSRDGQELKIAEEHPNAIVMLVAMNPEEIKKAPGPAASAEVRIGYLRMSVFASAMAAFVRALGFKAVACGNDTALSVPLAIDAGLGEAGRSGIVISPEFGSFVRICKVFTDMPLEVDQPVDMGLQDFCTKCAKCARKCPAEAISMAKEPTMSTGGPHTRPGVKRWPIDPVKCHDFWRTNGTSCSVCMAVCPFTAE